MSSFVNLQLCVLRWSFVSERASSNEPGHPESVSYSSCAQLACDDYGYAACPDAPTAHNPRCRRTCSHAHGLHHAGTTFQQLHRQLPFCPGNSLNTVSLLCCKETSRHRVVQKLFRSSTRTATSCLRQRRLMHLFVGLLQGTKVDDDDFQDFQEAPKAGDDSFTDFQGETGGTFPSVTSSQSRLNTDCLFSIVRDNGPQQVSI